MKYFELCPGLSSTHSSGEVEDDQLLVVSAVMPGATDLVPGFIRSVATHLPDATINLIDLGVSGYILPKLLFITFTISLIFDRLVLIFEENKIAEYLKQA